MSAVPGVEAGVLHRQVEVAIVGAGFGGLCLAIKLLEQGIRNFTLWPWSIWRYMFAPAGGTGAGSTA